MDDPVLIKYKQLCVAVFATNVVYLAVALKAAKQNKKINMHPVIYPDIFQKYRFQQGVWWQKPSET